MSTAYIVVRNDEVMAHAATYDKAIEYAKTDLEDCDASSNFIYGLVAHVQKEVTVKVVSAPTVKR